MSEPKKQHYVPQTYLNNFAMKRKNAFHLCIYSKNKKDYFVGNVEDTGVKKHFYTVNCLDEKYYWENYFSRDVETDYGVLLDEILKTCNCPILVDKAVILNNHQKLQLSKQIVIHFMRGIHARNYTRRIYDKSASLLRQEIKLLSELTGKDFTCVVEKYENDDDLFKQISLEVSFDKERIDMFTSILSKKTFIFVRINNQREFITSDNPVIFMDSFDQNVQPFANGLLKESTLIYFPLSYNVLLIVCDTNYGLGAFNCLDKRLYQLRKENDKRFIDFVNKKQYEHCYEYVYAYSENEFNTLQLCEI